MGFITTIIGAISAISTIVKFISAMKDAIGEAQFNSWLKDVEKNTVEWKAATTPEQKSAVAKNMVNLIGRLPS